MNARGSMQSPERQPVKSMKNGNLLTFGLLAYNQEDFIREAVQGAFAQTYEALEIVLSDDCSQDETFEIIKSMARTYNGPHRVRINQNSTNLGIANHVQAVFSMAEGSWVVLAAGDDISEPNRTEMMANKIASDGSLMAIFSDFSYINANGTFLEQHRKSNAQFSLAALAFSGGGVGAGATYAYARKVANWPWEIPGTIVCEDRLLPLRAAILGSLGHIPEPLVRYRRSRSSITYTKPRRELEPILQLHHTIEVSRTISAGVSGGFLTRSEGRITKRLLRTGKQIARIKIDRPWFIPTLAVRFLSLTLKLWTDFSNLLDRGLSKFRSSDIS